MIEGRGTVLNLNGYEVKCDRSDDGDFAIVVNGFGNTIKSGSGKCFRIVLGIHTIYPEFNFMFIILLSNKHWGCYQFTWD